MQVLKVLQNNLFFIKLDFPPPSFLRYIMLNKNLFFCILLVFFFFFLPTSCPFLVCFFILFTSKIYEHLFKRKKHWKNWREKERLYIWKAIKNHSECAVVIAFLKKQTRQAVWNVKESCVRAGPAAEAKGDALMAGVLGVPWGAVHFPCPPPSPLWPPHTGPERKWIYWKIKLKSFFRKIRRPRQPLSTNWGKNQWT